MLPDRVAGNETYARIRSGERHYKVDGSTMIQGAIMQLPATSTSASETMKPFRERFNTERAGGIIHWLFLLFAMSIPVAVLCFNRIMHVGHHTSFPPDDVRQGYTDGPDTRGTINIVWVCFSTIFTCAYVSLHLDVPYSEREPEGWKERILAALKSAKWKAMWIVISIVAPEFVTYVAVVEFTSARRRKIKVVGDYGIDDAVWTLKHQFFADMGGFKVPVKTGEPTKEGESTHTTKKKRGLNPDAVIIRSGADFYLWLERNRATIDSINFIQAGIDIQNCSKTDWLLKSLTILQASWLVVQSIVRAIESRPVSELEVTTCAYVACAIFTYCFWWHKPYGVQKHVLLHVDRTPHPDWIQKADPTPFNRTNSLIDYIAFWDANSTLELTAVILSGFVGASIGAIHCTLWNVTFTNTNGQLLWRICCIVQIVTPLAMSFFLAWRERHSKALCNTKVGKGLLTASFVTCFVQFCARVIIFILIMISFMSLPVGVYKNVDWSWSRFPHFN